MKTRTKEILMAIAIIAVGYFMFCLAAIIGG